MQPFHNSILYQNIEIYVSIKSNGNSRRDTNKITIITAHGKNCQCRKKVQRHSKTKFNPKFIVESTNSKSEMV